MVAVQPLPAFLCIHKIHLMYAVISMKGKRFMQSEEKPEYDFYTF